MLLILAIVMTRRIANRQPPLRYLTSKQKKGNAPIVVGLEVTLRNGHTTDQTDFLTEI